MKIEVNIDKRYFIIIISLIGILGVVLITNAYNPSGTGGNPIVMGHSADELDVEFGGSIQKLQQVFNQFDSNNDGIIDRANRADIADLAEVANSLDASNLDVDSLTTDTIDVNTICINGDCRNSWPDQTSEDTWLVNSQHTTQACSDNGGEIVSDGQGNNFCKFNIASCPAGWIQYKDWRTQKDNQKSGTPYYNGVYSCPGCTYYDGYAIAHGASWGDNPHNRCCKMPCAPCRDYSVEEQCSGCDYSGVGSGEINHYSIVTQVGCY